MKKLREEVKPVCVKVFDDTNIKSINYNETIYNPETRKIIHLVDTNPQFDYHPNGRKEIFDILRYSKRNLNYCIKSYKDQGPLEIIVRFIGFKGYVIKTLKLGN